MDPIVAIQIAVTNLFTKAVDLHNAVASKHDDLIKASETKQPLPAMTNAGIELKELSQIYKDLRDILIVSEYLSGHDIFTISNDFKITRPTIIKILKEHQVELRKE